MILSLILLIIPYMLHLVYQETKKSGFPGTARNHNETTQQRSGYTVRLFYWQSSKCSSVIIYLHANQYLHPELGLLG